MNDIDKKKRFEKAKQYIKDDYSIVNACKKAGIGKTTYYYFIKKENEQDNVKVITYKKEDEAINKRKYIRKQQKEKRIAIVIIDIVDAENISNIIKKVLS